MGDIRERSAMHEGRVVFQRLHQVGHQRVFQQHRHRAVGLKLARRDRFALAGLADHDIAKPPFEIGDRRGQAENRHDFRRDRDVIAGFAREPVGDAAETDRDVAQRPVVDIDDTAPGNAPGIHAQLVVPVQVVVDHGR